VDLTNLVLQATWQGPSTVLSPPPSSAAVSLVIKTVPSSTDKETFQGTLFLLNQLKTLEFMATCLRQGETWVHPEGVAVNSEKLDRFFEDAVDGSARAQTLNDVSLLNALEVISSLPIRSDLDFTEKLWNLCSASTGEDDLRVVLGAVFELLEKGEVFPMVHKNNTSTLATLVRDAIKVSRVQTSRDHQDQKGALAKAFQHWTSQALQCVIETGLCKIKRDYVHYLIGHDVATWESLVRRACFVGVWGFSCLLTPFFF